MSSFPMAGRGPRARYYAGANSLSIFSAQGSNPLQDCKVFGKGVTKVYDKTVKGYVYCIGGVLQSKLQLPKDDSKTGLQLLHHFLVLQLFVPVGVHFSVELRVSDTNNTRRKMYFSTSFSDIKSTPLHCQIPISMVIRNKWLSLAFHVADLFNSCFRGGVNFRSIDSIVLAPVCKLRKIFTMRCRITEIDPRGLLEEASEDCLPQEHMYATGVDTCIQTLDMSSLQSAVLSSNEVHADDSRPGPGGVGPDCGLSARKGAPLKTEHARVVHVAFGTRMPLPLSTVQINTNLPHDKSPTLVKDRIGKVHYVSDPAAAEAKESKHPPPDNMITRALSVASLNKEGQRRNADGAACDSSEMQKNRNRKAGSLPQTTEEKEPINLQASNGEPMRDGEEAILESKGQVVHDPLLDSPRMSSQDPSTIAEGHTSTDTANKSPTKWATRKREVQLSNHTKQQKKNQRAKEYEYSRYMDSPPGSPPCGWDRCTGGNQSDNITIHDHFLEGTWMNNQLSESVDAGKPYCLANSLKEKIMSSMPHTLSLRDHKEGTYAFHKDLSKDAHGFHLEQSTSQLPDDDDCGTFHEGFESNLAVRVSSVCSDLLNGYAGGDDDQFWKDSEDVASYDHCTEQYSWSSGSSSVPGGAQHDVSLSQSCEARDGGIQKLGTGTHSRSDLQSRLSTSLLAKESEMKSLDEEEGLMFDIHDDRFFPQHMTEKRPDMNGLGDHSITESVFSAEAKGLGASFDSSMEGDGDLEYALPDPPLKLMTTSDFRSFTRVPDRPAMEHDTIFTSWQGDNPDHCPSQKPLPNAEQIGDQQLEGPVRSNVRPDEDLDLLYDPTLDCYYDPKTNRYYELK